MMQSNSLCKFVTHDLSRRVLRLYTYSNNVKAVIEEIEPVIVHKKKEGNNKNELHKKFSIEIRKTKTQDWENN